MLPLLKKKSRVLVLDDDPSMQRLVATILRRDGHRVEVVSSGSQAIEKINKRNYAALLLDVMTPTEGAATVIRHLRKTHPAMLQRVILVTASPDSVLKTVARDTFGVVHKPFSAEDLSSTVQRLLASQ